MEELRSNRLSSGCLQELLGQLQVDAERKFTPEEMDLLLTMAPPSPTIFEFFSWLFTQEADSPALHLRNVGELYLAKVKVTRAAPIPFQMTESKPLGGTIAEFRELYKDDEKALRRLCNKVKLCPGCNKPCATTLRSCNGCARSLEDVPISFNDNVFMGFVYGIGQGKFPYTISLRAETADILCFDDPLVMSPMHLNAIPTSVYIPDLRYLFTDPARGLELVNKMFTTAAKVAMEDFWKNDEFRRTFLGGAEIPKTLQDLQPYVLGGMNYPPSMYQLHIQFIHAPLLPFHYAQALQDNHFHERRYFPLEWIQKALALGDAIQMKIVEDTDITVIIDRAAELGVSYDDARADLMRRMRTHQNAWKPWKENDFETAVINGKVFDLSSFQHLPDQDPKAIQASDSKLLQNYGRPFGQDGRPSGTYYRFAKKPSDVADWC